MTNYHANSSLVNPPDHSKMTNKGESDYSRLDSTARVKRARVISASAW